MKKRLNKKRRITAFVIGLLMAGLLVMAWRGCGDETGPGVLLYEDEDGIGALLYEDEDGSGRVIITEDVK